MLYFNIQNFRVFNEDAFLDLRADTRKTKYAENLITTTCKNCKQKKLKLLPYSVIYGGNASGKTSIIKAMALIKNIVLDGRIFSDNPREILHSLELFPYLHDYSKYVKPMKLSIGFIFDDKKYEFMLKVKCSLRKEYFFADKEIYEEQLYIDDQEIYFRDLNSVRFEGETVKIGQEDGQEHITKEELFLYSRFKTGKYNTDFQNIISWFRFKFIVIDDITKLRTIIETSNSPSGKVVDLKNRVVDAITSVSDFGPQEIFYRINSSESGSNIEMMSCYALKGHPGQGIDTLAKNTESTGTIKLIHLASFLFDSLVNGNTVVIDELDSSLHFALIKEITNLYTNPEINIGKGQLIFTSHNPIFIPLVKIRRDQIYFVEKNPETFSTSLYSLSDFPSEDVRTSEAFIKNYLDGKYGALPSIDFEEEIKRIVSSFGEVKANVSKNTSN